MRDDGCAGVPTQGFFMSRYGIDETEGTVNVYDACPNEGDSVMIVNCGDHFEIRHHSRSASPEAKLTEEDIKHLQQGSIIWH